MKCLKQIIKHSEINTGASIRALTKSKGLWGRAVFREQGSLKMIDSVGDLNTFMAAQKIQIKL